ncbi:MAG: hypothetical protein WA484_10800, partial [Solirubrobacteraceae bacterium]
MPTGSHSHRTIDTFVASAPPLQRTGMRTLIALSRRPRGAALLARVPEANQLARIVMALGRYDDPEVGRALGWDGAEVVA